MEVEKTMAVELTCTRVGSACFLDVFAVACVGCIVVVVVGVGMDWLSCIG